MRRSCAIFSAACAVLLLAAAGWSPPAVAESANSLAVEARLAWNEAQDSVDPVRRLRLLRSTVADFQTILDQYRDSDRAVEVVADAEVAGLVPSQVRATVAEMEARLPACEARPLRPCLLALADRLIAEDPAEGARNRALFALARYQVAAGFPARAVAALERIDWEQAPPPSLSRLVRPLLALERIDTALSLTEGLPSGPARDDLLAFIADHQAQKWFLGDAVETAQRIAAPSRRGTALSGIALRRAEGGDLDGAIRLFRDIYADDPNWMPAMTAVASAKAGHLQEALDLRAQIRDPFPMAWVTGHVATALAREGRLAEAESYFTRAEDLTNSVASADRRIWLFQDLALAKQTSGFLEPARQMLARAVQSFVPESRGAGRDAMADGLVDAAQRLGEPALLLGLGVATAPDETLRLDALQALIQALANRDALTEALALTETAFKAVGAPDAPAAAPPPWLLATRARLQARGGDLDTALASLGVLHDTPLADQVLVAIAAARAEASHVEEALMTTIGIETPAAKGQAYVEIVQGLTRTDSAGGTDAQP